MAEQAASGEARQDSVFEVAYDAAYFQNYWGGGGPYERNERWLKFFGDVAEGLIRDFHPATALDVGCAMGFLVEQLRERGVDAGGIDVSEYAIGQAHESVAEHVSVASVTEPIEGRYDLITCIEVLEHVPPEEADRAIANLCAATDRIVISSTPEDFGEPTHVNVMPPEAWAAKLAQNGFIHDLDRDLSYISPWAAVYVRSEEQQDDTVRRYERSWWRLRREVGEVRESLLDSQRRLAELEKQQREEAERRPELLEELDRSKEEILRLRDLLIAKDAELGAAKGLVAQMEDRARRMNAAKKRVEEKIPVFGRLFGALISLLRGRRD